MMKMDFWIYGGGVCRWGKMMMGRMMMVRRSVCDEVSSLFHSQAMR